MPDLRWYLHRALAMSPAEVVHRLRLALRKQAWRRQLRRPAVTSPFHVHWERMDWTPPVLALDITLPEAQALLAEAEAYLRHEWHFFGLDGLREEPIGWHTDPASGRTAPRRFGFDIDHRDENLVGDIKVIWEKSRHHHLTVLAVAYQLTRDERYAREVADQILDWVAQNPYLVGVNWTHPLEQGIRLIAWVWCERLLRSSPHHQRAFGAKSPVWRSIYDHQEFIAQTFSRGSSANNHLVGEMAGLFIAATAWPIFNRSAYWRQLARTVLEREVIVQTFPSGTNREMAFSYHLFVAEFLLLALAEAVRAGSDLSPSYRSALTRILTAIPQLTDAGGNLPRYGDGDEGRAVQLQASGIRRDAWLYRVGRSLLGADLPVSQAGQLAAAVLGCASAAPAAPPPPPGSVAFADAGLFVLAYRRGQPKEVFVLADAGPLGFLSIAAHGHADALSFALSVGGQPVIVDPGTFVYHTVHRWRAYFRGTRAHNTITVDDVDQSVQGGAFMWTRKAQTRVLTWEPTPTGGLLVAEHDGYARLPGKVIHRRRWSLNGLQLQVEDQLRGRGHHRLDWRLHFAPHCELTLDSPSCHVRWPAGALTIQLDPRLHWRVARAEDAAGWYSPAFKQKQPTNTLVGTLQTSLPVTLINTLEVHRES